MATIFQQPGEGMNPLMQMLQKLQPPEAGGPPLPGGSPLMTAPPQPEMAGSPGDGGQNPLALMQPQVQPPDQMQNDIWNLEDRQRDTQKKSEDVMTMLLRGMTTQEAPPTKGQMASNMLANFARGALMGKEFKSIEQEQLERRHTEQQIKTAQANSVLSTLRAQIADQNAQQTNLRLQQKMAQDETFRRDNMARLQQENAVKEARLRDQVAINKQYVDLRGKQLKSQEDYNNARLVLEKSRQLYGSPYAQAEALANYQAQLQGRDKATTEEVHKQYMDNIEWEKKITAQYRPVQTGRMALPGGDLNPQQLSTVSRAISTANSDPLIKNYQDIALMHGMIRDNATPGTDGQLSGPASMAVLREFAKLLDSRTGVREEEYRAMMKAAGILNTFDLYRSGQFINGTLLTPQAAQKFVEVADKVLARADKMHEPAVRKYVMQLQSAGVDNPYDRLGLRPPVLGIDEPPTPTAPAKKPTISAPPPAGAGNSGGGAAPTVGSTFNGRKVLKVERVK